MAGAVGDSYVYLDWAATAPLRQAALNAMAPFLEPGCAGIAANANPNSLHAPGRAAFVALEEARRSLARSFGAQRPDEVVLTGGATESDNMALWGMAWGAAERRKLVPGSQDRRPVVVVSCLEHDAILEYAHEMERAGFGVRYADCDRRGFVTQDLLQRVLDGSVVLVSVQAANSEVGSVQPVAELAACAHAAGALFHTDATQALGRIPFSASELGVDAASFSGHKLGAQKGIGALYLKAKTPFRPFMLGGGQEAGRRPGTQNACGAAGFAAACVDALSQMESDRARQVRMRDWLYGRLAELPGVKATVDVAPESSDFLPNIVHVTVKGWESEMLVLKLDERGFGVSGGSACSSHSLKPSHVLTAMGLPADRAQSALRVSFGCETTQEDLESFARALAEMLRA